MRQILLAVFTVAFLGCVVSSQLSNSWIKVTSLDGFLSSSVGTTKTAWSVLQCGRACTLDSECLSYFFNAGKSMYNCQLHDVVFQNMSSMVPTPQVTYYIPANHHMPTFQPSSVSTTTTGNYVYETPAVLYVSASQATTSQETTSQEVYTVSPFQCHENDGEFHSVPFSDGSTFYYKFDQTYSFYHEAVELCTNQSARLVRVTTDAKLEVLRQMMLCPDFSTFQRVYVDGKYNGADGTWYWYGDTQNEANYSPSFWAHGNPFDFSHGCSRLAKTSDWYGENWSCIYHASPSFCEMA